MQRPVAAVLVTYCGLCVRRCVSVSNATVNCAKTAKPIEVLFGL